MILLLLSILWCLVVAALLFRAITQYSHYEKIGPIPWDPSRAAPLVSVIVPARNEQRNIGRCIAALLEQQYPSDRLAVIAIDDQSEDQTPTIMRQIAQRDPRFHLIEAPPLPPGWLGKPHACTHGAETARGEWLCFFDADTTAQPPLIGTAVKTAIERDVGLLSLQPFQQLVSPWERLILPAGFFLLAFTQDLRKTNDPGSPDASVNGQFLLVRRSAYDGAGGHTEVRDQISEDSALAANVKAAGHRVIVLGTEGLLSTRMYAELTSLLEGTARQAAELLGGTLALLLAALAAIALGLAATALPLAGAVALSSHFALKGLVAFVLATAASAAMLGTHIGAARYFRIPWWYGLLFPISYLSGAGVLGYAIWQQTHGQVRWKGRNYSQGCRHDISCGTRVSPVHASQMSGTHPDSGAGS